MQKTSAQQESSPIANDYFKPLLKLAFILGHVSLCQIAQALPPFNAKAEVSHVGERYSITASFEAPLSLCQSYAFLTDYEGAKNIPGVSESKILSHSNNVTTVARVAHEQFFLVPIELHSVITYTQRPSDYAVDFEQESGDTRFYKGVWQLFPKGDQTLFLYKSQVEPGSVFPAWVVEYFIEKRMLDRVQTMAQRATNFAPAIQAASCP